MNFKHIFPVSVLTLMAAASCSDDESAAPYFTIENEPDNVEIPAAGISKSKLSTLTIRSNRPWTVTLGRADDARWVGLFAEEGRDDGIFRYYVARNTDFTDRTAQLTFIVNGTPRAKTITLHQAADIPTVAIANAAEGYKALAAGGVLKVPVRHNIDWTASLSENNGWATIDSCGHDTVYVGLQPNADDTRSVTLVCRGTGQYADRMSSTTITQADAGIYLNERFDWLKEGITDYYYNYPEVNFSKWSDEEKSYGWTTMGEALYGGQGYVKLGKTNYAGDLLLPPLASIAGRQDIRVSFKAIGYVSKGGAKDDGVLHAVVIGDGTLVGEVTDFVVGDQVYPAKAMSVTVYPNSANNENGADYDPWAQPGASFAFDIKGATAQTRILIVGGAKAGAALKGVGQGKNRVLLDDFKVRQLLPE